MPNDWDPKQWEEALRKAQRGSKDELGVILESFRPYLLSVANQELDEELRAKGGASDLVQETFLRAHDAIEGFRGTSQPELLGWLRQILLNFLGNFRRHFQVADKRAIRKEISLDESGNEKVGEWLAGDVTTPSEKCYLSEQLLKLQHAIDLLPGRYREVVIWRNLELLPFSEIGHRLGIAESTAQKLWVRAIQTLQQILNPET